MNELARTLLNHEYLNSKMKKQIYIFQRSKKKRIRDKAFDKLFAAYTDDKPFSIIGDVVLMKYELYLEILNQTEELKEYLETIDKGGGS